MSGLKTTWQGQLCHKSKVIAEVRALAGQDLPITIPSRLDVHQKVKFEEFKDKVVSKISGKLSFDAYVTHDEHLLLVTLLDARTGSAVLDSFNNFLYKSQSVGVSLIGENGSVIFLVPAKLDPGGLFPIFPHTEDLEEPSMYGVIKISRTLVATITQTMVKTEDSPTKVKQEKVNIPTTEKSPILVTDDFEESSTSVPSTDLTRLSVYMSNLPALERRDPKESEKATPQEIKEKTRLSLSQYRQRSKEVVEHNQVTVPANTNDYLRNSDSVSSYSGIEGEMEKNRTGAEKQSEGSGESSFGVTTRDTDHLTRAEVKTVSDGVLDSHQSTAAEWSDSGSERHIVTEVQNISHESTMSDHKHQTQNVPCHSLKQIYMAAHANQYEKTFSKRIFDNEPMFVSVSNKFGTVNSTDDSLPNLDTRDDSVMLTKENDAEAITPSAKVIPLDMEVESSEETKVLSLKVMENQDMIGHQSRLPEQQFQISPELLMDEQTKAQTMLNPVTTVKTEWEDTAYTKYTIIEPVEVEEKDQPKGHASIQSYFKPYLFEEGIEQDLPDLADNNGLPEDEESPMNPGESVTFKKTESVIFTPNIYAKILDDLDTLKLLLGETAMQNSTAHRERCMLMVDKIGDKLIGTRLRKTCITKSFGSVTDARQCYNPSKEVQTEFDSTDTEGLNIGQGTAKRIENDSATDSDRSSTNSHHKSNRNKGHLNRTSEVSSNRTNEKPLRKSKRVVSEEGNNKPSKSNKKRRRSESSNNTDEEAEGYFTMLLKLNGALDEEKRRSKTVTRVHKTSVRRITKSNVENREAEVGIAPVKETEDRYCGTPEIGASSHEGSSVKLIDGRLRYTKQDSYVGGNTKGSVEEPQHGAVSTPQVGTSPWPQALPWYGTAGGQQVNYHATESQYSNSPQQGREHLEQPVHTIQVPPADASKLNGYLSKDSTLSETSQERNTQSYGNNVAQASSQTQQYGYIEYPSNSLESDIQKSLHDVDLRQMTFPGPASVPSVNTSFQPLAANSIVSYENTLSTSVIPNVNSSMTTVNTTTESSAFYTDSSVTVYNEQQVIDQEMESEMVDILEILHDGKGPESVGLKKPKGRSKRARKKRRAIAEAEKLYSMVVIAQKIEKQQKLNVLSEKQKKREFYKKIIHTYAGKGDESVKPKDEESMILECVEQLMETQSDTEEGSVKTESTDQANKKKGEDDFALDDYDGLSEFGGAKGTDEIEGQIIENIRHERYLSDLVNTKDRSNQPVGRSQRDSSTRVKRSSSRDRSVNSSPERSHRSRSLSRPCSEKHRRNICHEMDSQPAMLNISPEQKNQMFQSWTNKRYISHLFTTANKITFGSDSTRSWTSKVIASLKAIVQRKKALTEHGEEIKRAMRTSRGVSFRQRERAEQQRVEYIDDLREFETLEALFEFYSCKFIILEVLQNASREKQVNPNKENDILKTLCQKLDRQLESLRKTRGLLDLQMKLNLGMSDRRLVAKACNECVDMIENIRKETRKHKEQTSK